MSDARSADLAALLLRLTLGVAFIAHALLKVFVFTMPGTVAFFESLGLPGFTGWLVMLAELGGGIALILGIQVRLVALLLLPIMFGATWTHAGNGWLFTGAGGGWEYPAFWTATVAVQALLGAGAYALRIPGVPEFLRVGEPASVRA